MKYKSAKVPRRLAFAREALTAAVKNKQIAKALERFGYDAERIDEGERLLTYAERMQGSLELNGRPETPDDLKSRLKEDKDRFWELKTVASVALKKKHQLIVDLFIDRPVDTTIAGFFRQAEHFYDSIIGNTLITKELARFNVDDDTLIEAKITLEDTMESFKTHFQEFGSALTAVRIRDDAMDTLDRYMEDFIKITQVCFHRDPALLKTMGFKAK